MYHFTEQNSSRQTEHKLKKPKIQGESSLGVQNINYLPQPRVEKVPEPLVSVSVYTSCCEPESEQGTETVSVHVCHVTVIALLLLKRKKTTVSDLYIFNC